jgi:hypothetical protein
MHEPTEPIKETPNTLDVMDIEGRLAQLVTPRAITWLDTQESQDDFDINNYDVTLGKEKGVIVMQDYFEKNPDKKHLLNKVHWSENDTDYLKGQVKFFGWLKSKKQ